MFDPITIGATLTGIITAIGKIAEHKIIAYLIVLALLTADTQTNLVGTLLSGIVALMGIPAPIYSGQLVAIFAIFPVAWWIWDKSG